MLSPDSRYRRRLPPVRHALGVTILVLGAVLLLGSPPGSASRAQGPDPATLADAIRAQQALVAEQPGNPDLLSDLGNLLALAGQRDQALTAYRSALTIDPEDPALMYNLALLLGEMRQPREALELHRDVARLEPDNAWNLYQIGRLEAAAGREDAAIEAYARAFALAPELTFPDVNPHLLENDLMTAALLRIDSLPPSYRESPPRAYRDSARIAGLLLPPPPPAPAETEGPETPAPEESHEAPPPAPTVMAPRPDDDAAEPSAPPPAPAQDRVDSGDEDRPRRTLTVDDLDSLRVRNQAAGEAESSSPSPTGRPVRTRPIPRPSTDPRTLPTPPGPAPQAQPTPQTQPGGSFQPSRRSSAQLGVELLPPRTERAG